MPTPTCLPASIYATTVLDTITCPNCSGVYAISQAYQQEAREQGGFKLCWTCPYCKTSRGYGKGAHEKEKEELRQRLAHEEAVARSSREQRDRALAEADHFRKSRDGMKGKLVSVQRRSKAGVCPCCTRTFTNMARHMATKHPKFACEKVEAAP